MYSLTGDPTWAACVTDEHSVVMKNDLYRMVIQVYHIHIATTQTHLSKQHSQIRCHRSTWFANSLAPVSNDNVCILIILFDNPLK